MIYYLYESHLGDAYITKRKMSYDETYCDVCRDRDELLGEFKTEKQLRKLLTYENFYQQYIDDVVKKWKEANNDD